MFGVRSVPVTNVMGSWIRFHDRKRVSRDPGYSRGSHHFSHSLVNYDRPCSVMDLLKKEMERKRQALASAKAAAATLTQNHPSTNGSNNNGKRYIKASDLRRFQEQNEETNVANRKRERASRENADEQQHTDETITSATKHAKTDPVDKERSTKATDSSSTKMEEVIENYSSQELTIKLRQLGLAVRLFGEENDSRKLRLREAMTLQHEQMASVTEQNEFRLGHGHGIRNPFLERNEDAASAAHDTVEQKPRDAKAMAAEEEDISDDPNKRIHRYLKGLLKQWEDDLVGRPEEEKRSVAGRNETKTYKQCKDYIRPLFKLCKKRQLEESIVSHLIKIIDFCEQEEFVKANDTYMDLAIGRAAWPIGVTMVGIHARSGREKIASGNVAHVMNSELQRKYLTSVKRLMTFAQKKSDVDPSKKVSM
ncbi:hypothetical protein MPSEU_000306900 [Mayamaea pseudoterrestris]|nr:hypothetical protein MPSEU_000306900 [Mayamaea pseudoterrestris]